MDSGSYSADTLENEAKPPVTDDGMGQKQTLINKYKDNICVNLFGASDERVEGGNEEEDHRKGAADEQSADESAEGGSEEEDRHQLDERSVEEESEEEDRHQLPIESRKFLAEEEVATEQTWKRLNEEYEALKTRAHKLSPSPKKRQKMSTKYEDEDDRKAVELDSLRLADEWINNKVRECGLKMLIWDSYSADDSQSHLIESPMELGNHRFLIMSKGEKEKERREENEAHLFRKFNHFWVSEIKFILSGGAYFGGYSSLDDWYEGEE